MKRHIAFDIDKAQYFSLLNTTLWLSASGNWYEETNLPLDQGRFKKITPERAVFLIQETSEEVGYQDGYRDARTEQNIEPVNM